MKQKIAVYRKEHFNAAHRLHNPLWSDEENKKVFGKCNNPSFHGHNYELIVKVIGYPDEQTGYLVDMKILSDIIQDHVVEKFDHKNLNLDVEEFKDLNPTAENIAMVIWNILRAQLDTALDLYVTLFETERNYVEYPA
ncbi:6-pyruvoyl trahydropterin synthase family protein [Pedobacter puniceum]|jgi:6-pyruvoyltetrahydropterin/6-carboxytetrahydropterin synthase|uniref:6-carboxy-5,6,7,8-tetrahydropterin synthase n=1 Tax=Pedobacter puniceum TaxID=2666136 RepID=A0A7K0FPE5_9SPHI|nr:6-carboxytetrahydropterin synthase [Pedobacter puniceum]MRX47848.1 6-carboxytetrahydropterin synthase [Pedobacter puniceum]